LNISFMLNKTNESFTFSLKRHCTSISYKKCMHLSTRTWRIVSKFIKHLPFDLLKFNVSTNICILLRSRTYSIIIMIYHKDIDI
jgi:hypothetical protein